jgi:FXSXX-COOH protein
LDVAIDTQSDLVSGVADLRRVPLGQLSDSARGAVGSTLNRVVAGNAAGRVPVAAFNASI